MGFSTQNTFNSEAGATEDHSQNAAVIRSQALEKLAHVISMLRDNTTAVGGKFVGLGAALQDLYGQSESLLEATRNHTAMLGADGENKLLKEIGAAATSSVDALKQGQQHNTVLLRHIQDTVGVVKSLSKSVESIIVVGSQLGIIGTNLAIQTSRLQSGVETFGDFSSEIKSFSAYISRFAADIEQDTEDVISILSEVRARMDSKSSHMESFIDRAQLSSNLTIDEIQDLIRHSSLLLAEKSRHSEEISRQTNKAVIAIQVDDITRQRLEHVIDALQGIVGEEDFSKNRMVLKIQASQIREVGKSLEKAFNEMSGAFSNIGKEISAINPAAETNQTSSQSASKSLRHLQKTLLGLEKIHEDARDLRQSMSAGLDRAIIASETISRHVVDVSTITQELNLKAINALLMSRQLGSDGGNLVVLAKELHTLSKDSIEFVTLVKEKIEHVAEVTTMLKNNTLEQSVQGDETHSFDGQISAMNETVSFFDQAAEDTGKRASKIQRNLFEIESSLSFLKIASSRLHSCADDAEAIVEMTAALVDSDHDASQIHSLYDKYTMEQERRVHRAMQNGDAELSSDESPEVKNEDDELGDFELF